MFVTKDRPGAGSENRQDRTIEDTASRMDVRGALRFFAEHSRSRGESARVELKRSLRASEEASKHLIEASLQGLLSVHTLHMIKFPYRDAEGKTSVLGAIAAAVPEHKHAEARGTIGLCQDGGQRGR